MIQLGRADALEHLDAIGVEPAPVNLRWQRLPRGKTQPQREVALVGARVLEHRAHHGRDLHHDRRAMQLDQVEEQLGRRAVAEDDAGAPTPNVNSVAASRA